MVKTLLLFVIYGISSLTKTSAVDGEGVKPSTHVVGDTTVVTDSLKIVDPKSAFKDLFIHTTETGVQFSQLNPKAVSFVQDYMKKETANLSKLRGWGKPYFDMMDAVLKLHGLPVELKYLAVIESNLKSSATSWVGAVGPWQFMPETGRELGLVVNGRVDERRDYYKSTHAAAKYLTNLFDQFGDWLLVLAAYNGGPGKVYTAIKKSGSRDFWTLQKYLPTESRNHVKKFIATHYILEGQGGLTTLTKEETKNFAFASATATAASGPVTEPVDANMRNLAISGKYNSIVISKHLAMDITEFNRLNPNFDHQIALSGNYDLRLPSEKLDLFLAKKYSILNESIQVTLGAANAAARTTR